MRKAVLSLLLATSLPISTPVGAEMETRTDNGINDYRAGPLALTNGTLVIAPGNEATNKVLLVRDGRVEQLTNKVPAGYQVVDLNGGYVYPGFVDAYSHYGMPKVGEKAKSRWSGPEVLNSTSRMATNANEAIKSHLNAVELFTPNVKQAEAYRNLGFTSVVTAQPDGVARGTSAAVLTSDGLPNELVITDRVATHYSFDKGSSKQFYPISRMGVVSLLRQTDMDAEWYSNQDPKPFADVSLESYVSHNDLPKVMSAFDWKTVLLADKVGDELGHQYVIRGGGDEYQRVDAVKQTDATLILDVNFPKAPDVANTALAEYIHLRQLKHWELAPYNLSKVEAANIPFVITSQGTDKAFWQNLKLAVRNGLSEESALGAITTAPASLMGLDAEVGSLRNGRLANFVITDGPLFAKPTRILSTWIRGDKFQVAHAAQLTPGSYELTLNGAGESSGFPLTVEQDGDKFKAKLSDKSDKKPAKAKIKVEDDYINLVLRKEGQAAQIELWLVDGAWKGNGQDFSGQLVSARLVSVATEKEAEEKAPNEPEVVGDVIYPFVAHGSSEPAKQEMLLIQNATVWTNEDAGILENTDVLLKDGKIAEVGSDLKARGARVIDGSGLHLTPGIIDEHSHIALDGVNDFATNSSMVRMADVVDSEDVGIYRALAGGVTAAQLLHGSANPIGGQSALIKMRWGQTPEGLLIKDADPFIKFALGENVKRASNKESTRFPQTRMGVEQFYVDAFNEARQYQARWDAFEKLPRRKQLDSEKPRRDLRMDTLVEILNGERFVTSHSYVQSEINMLMKVAEQFDFRINTFTHILEGYKVADIMAAHGVGGSTFSDWWAYKWEVRYAIPYNAALMHQAGVTTAINSDDAEMLRRLNQEAAKSVRNGGMNEQDALKMVTLNPAKLLHLDDRMGSIAVGKDADVVLWSDHPLSVYAKALTTIVDGTVYFDRQQDEVLQAQIKAERQRLVQKVLNKGKGNGNGTAPPDPAKLNYNHDMLHLMVEQATGAESLEAGHE